MELTQAEKLSPLWSKLVKLLDEKIEGTHLRLEAPLDLFHTTELRGRIKAFRLIKSLGDEQPLIDEDGQPLPD